MRKFIGKFFLFSILVMLYFIPPTGILFLSKESFSNLDNYIENRSKYMIGYAYSGTNYQYLKWKTIESGSKYEVLALGSSRVAQFRQGMFNKSFYNAGFSVSKVSEFIPFLKSLPPNKLPNVLLLGMDQWMFNGNWDNLEEEVKYDLWSKSLSMTPSIQVMNDTWKDFIKGKYHLEDVLFQDESDGIVHIGLNSVINKKGFRNDGSMAYGSHVLRLMEDSTLAGNYTYTFGLIEKGERMFAYGDDLNAEAVKEVAQLLSFCEENNVYVVGFLPPFGDAVNQKMMKSGHYKYIDRVFPECNKVFQKHGFEFWDMTNLRDFQSSDLETLDGFHGGELSYVKMLIYMIKEGSRLKGYTDYRNLLSDIDNPKNRYEVYSY